MLIHILFQKLNLLLSNAPPYHMQINEHSPYVNNFRYQLVPYTQQSLNLLQIIDEATFLFQEADISSLLLLYILIQT